MDVWLAADECGPADVKSRGPGAPMLALTYDDAFSVAQGRWLPSRYTGESAYKR